jgi:formate-dependent nitrite reductase membrane component NrfD
MIDPSRTSRGSRPLTDHAPAPGESDAAMPTGYHGVPVIHAAHWKWLIVSYFYLGGIAAASYAVAVVDRWVGPPDDRRVEQAGRYLSLAALLPCPILLILDLGRPRRFLNMVRRFNPRSPMSVGIWGVLAFSLCSGLSAVEQTARDRLLPSSLTRRSLGRLSITALDTAGGALALFVGGYTGVLLGSTAVPLWTKRAALLGPLFLSSAFSTGTSAITLVLAALPGTPERTLARLDRLETFALLAEGSLLAGWLVSLGPTARPLLERSTGAALRHGTVGGGITLPFAIQATKRRLPASAQRPLTIAASTLVMIGGFCLRYAVVVGGQASADDPGATFDLTRSRPRRS